MKNTGNILQSLSWNITYRCNLRCPHCYLNATERVKKEKELTLERCKVIIDEICEINKKSCLILTGGEPLLRDDLFDIARYASTRGITVFLGTNGTLIDKETIEKIQDSGINGVGISIDSLKPELHDSFRGVKGSWERAIRGLELLKEGGISSLIQFSLMDFNCDEIEDMVKFAVSLEHRVLNIYYLVCTGRGERYSNIPVDSYEETLYRIARLQSKYVDDIWLNVKCAPSYKRVLYELDKDSVWMKTYRGGCPAGLYYSRITPEGYVTPCPYMTIVCGDLRVDSFKNVWEGSSVFQNLRQGMLKGRCGRCEFLELCIGCRARAFADTGDYMAEDRLCSYEPGGEKEKVSLSSGEFYVKEEGLNLAWDDEAIAVLDRIPSFARSLVIKGVEDFARLRGFGRVTTEVMHRARGQFRSKED